jgi:putative transposase
MLRTIQFGCTLSKDEADALNAESGRLYTDTLTCHYRISRRTGVWLRPEQGERWEDAHGGPTTLQAHSRDAAQQGLYTACKTAKVCQAAGLDTKYLYHRKRWRTTIWKASGIRLEDRALRLARARGLTPVMVPLPPQLVSLSLAAYREARLVWDRAAQHYAWQLVVDDGVPPAPAPPGDQTAAIDLGEIHPAAVTDGTETVIFTCRALRSNQQDTAKRVGELKAKQDRKHQGSRRWKRLQRRTTRFRAQQRRRARDLEHQVSRAVVDWATERQIHTLVIGDVPDVADGKRLNRKSQQKIGVWSHGHQRQYITYEAEAAGITVVLVDEAYTSQTCPGTLPDGTACLHCYKPTGRVYRCPACGLTAHRDGLGAANLLSQHYTGEPGHVRPARETYRSPVVGKRRRLDTRELARVPTVG